MTHPKNKLGMSHLLCGAIFPAPTPAIARLSANYAPWRGDGDELKGPGGMDGRTYFVKPLVEGR